MASSLLSVIYNSLINIYPMARIKYGGLITDISGSVGSTTMQRGQFGPIMRNKPHQTGTPSTRQSFIRSAMARCHYAWRTLTQVQREEWRRYIDFTSPIIKREQGILLTGHALFIKYNMLQLLTGRSILTALTYPNIPEWPIIDGIEYVSDLNSRILMNIDMTAYPVKGLIKLSQPRPASQRFNAKGLRRLTDITIEGVQFGIGPAVLDALGLVLKDQMRVHLSVQWFSTTAPIISQVYNQIIIVEAL